ncbi:MAG: RecX family transcriptional regulator [Roseomonas sp.]|nr:RecX family transcriptional regulator [Roseomonas sp.]
MSSERGRPGGKAPRPAGHPPDAARLAEAAAAHLARFAATEAGLQRVLARRIDRWARAAEAEGQLDVAPRAAAAKAAIADVARRLVAGGAVDDAAFAESRARRLLRTGRSRRATLAHLREKGVDATTAAAALPEGEAVEMAAALAFCRRRRIGPFGLAEPPPEARLKALGARARAGFGRDVASRALRMAPEEAEARLIAARQA